MCTHCAATLAAWQGCNSNADYCNTIGGFFSYITVAEESQHLDFIPEWFDESHDTVAFILAQRVA